MFSAKLYIKYPQSIFVEEKDANGNYLGTYTVSLPCSLFLDEELSKEIGSYTITLTGLSIQDCNPSFVYQKAMEHFESPTHIA